MLNILIIDQDPLVGIEIQALVKIALQNKAQTQLVSSKNELDGLTTNSKIDLFILGLGENSEIDAAYLKKNIDEIPPQIPLIVFYDTFFIESMPPLSRQSGIGFISKPRMKDELSIGLTCVLKGEMYLCEDTSQSIINAWTEKRSISVKTN